MAQVRQPTPQHERLEAITQRLDEEGSVRIDDLADELAVSEMTIRRDLDELEAQGLVRRVRGGALPVRPETFAERHLLNAKPKGRIAEKLAELLPTSGTVAFDASSTVHRLAATIEGARDLIVVTNGLDTFQVLQDRPGVTPVLTGGTKEPRTGSLVGPLATRSAEDFLFDVFIGSSAALDPDLGSSEPCIAEAEIKRAYATHSARTVLAVDHTKLGTRSQARVFDLESLDVLVTDLDPDDERLAAFRGQVELL